MEPRKASKLWIRRIHEAEKRGRFTDTDKDLANQWCTCAVGEGTRLRGLPIYTAVVTNDTLRTVGLQFVDDVMGDNVKSASGAYYRLLQIMRGLYGPRRKRQPRKDR